MTPQEEKAKRKREQERQAAAENAAVDNATAPAAATSETAVETTTGQQMETNAPVAAVPDNTRQQLEAGYNQNIQDFYTMAMNKKAEMDEALAADQKRETEMRDAARFSGVTEAAASIANLIGTASFGASPQQYKSYSQGWMNKADEARKERLTRRDNYRQQLESLNAKLSALKSGKATALANYDTEAPLKQARVAASYLRAEAAKLAAEAKAASSEADANKKTAEANRLNAQAAEIESRIPYNTARAGYYDARAGLATSQAGYYDAKAQAEQSALDKYK